MTETERLIQYLYSQNSPPDTSLLQTHIFEEIHRIINWFVKRSLLACYIVQIRNECMFVSYKGTCYLLGKANKSQEVQSTCTGSCPPQKAFLFFFRNLYKE